MADLTVTVIGGGIAGVAAAYSLVTSETRMSVDVRLLESEPTLAFHTTGRSAAQLIRNYGSGPVRPLTTASLDFLRSPPEDLVDGPLLRPRPLLTVARRDQDDTIERTFADARRDGVAVDEISIEEAVALFPLLKGHRLARAAVERDSADIDVASLHQAFVRGLRRGGGAVMTGQPVHTIAADGAGWVVHHGSHRHHCDVVVDAAGAWGDVIALSAGVEPVGLQPMRRTVFMTRSPHPDSSDWPLVADADHDWYLKPDGPQFLCSPADETPSHPCDAKPREEDVAIAIERINTATTLGIRAVTSTWAGLRTFAPDRAMVIGPEPGRPSFVWLVGQGGTGIQTAPGAGRLVADLVLTGRSSTSFEGTGLDLAALAPDRFR